jgi:hypothetical protein
VSFACRLAIEELIEIDPGLSPPAAGASGALLTDALGAPALGGEGGWELLIFTFYTFSCSNDSDIAIGPFENFFSAVVDKIA